ncbi:MAG TPA: hypothetical protein VFK54_08235 [Candidatus Limnocylindrales bacterium]|nr:hypothetical protein [Candidatus Limnocylindrales bacterium]
MFSSFVQEQPIRLTLYTDAFIVHGTIRTRQRRVTDILNERETVFLVLADVEIERFGAGGTSRAEFAQVNLDAVLFAVADTPVEPVPELRMPKFTEQAMISVPPFTIVGTIHLQPDDAGLRASLEELIGRFLPATQATYWSESSGGARRTALLVAFNHARAQILTPYAGDGG